MPDHTPMTFVSDSAARKAALDPEYKALAAEAMLLDSVRTDIEDATDLDEARRIISARINDLWTRSRIRLTEVAVSETEAKR